MGPQPRHGERKKRFRRVADGEPWRECSGAGPTRHGSVVHAGARARGTQRSRGARALRSTAQRLEKRSQTAGRRVSRVFGRRARFPRSSASSPAQAVK